MYFILAKKQSVKVLQDSGKRRKFKSGAVRDVVTGKGRFDLISPIALRALAKHYENGAAKYDPRNWEKGMPISVCIDSAERHINEFKEGSRVEDHLSAIMWNAAAAKHIMTMVERGLMPKEFMDLPNYLPKGKKVVWKKRR